MLVRNPVIRGTELESIFVKLQTAGSFSPKAALLGFVTYRFCMFCSHLEQDEELLGTISYFT